MNEIVNIFLLAKDKLMLEMHLKQTRFTYSACGPFTNNKERIQKIKETGDSRYIYQIELEKTCFQHDMAYGDFIYLTRITASDKILRDKAFNIAKNPKKDGYQRGLVSIVYKFFDKKASGSGSKNKNILNKELAEELHKPLIRKCQKGKEHSLFTGNIWRADIADMQLTRKFDKGICFLLHVIEFSVNMHGLFL